MNRFASFILAACITAVGLNASVHADSHETAVKVQPLRGALHLLQGRGGNVVASVGLDGVLLIDNDYADLGEAYEKAMAELTQSDLAPGFIVNTHWHGDHTGNNEFWGYRGSVIIAHGNVRQRMSTKQEMKALGRTVEASPAIALPIVTFKDSLALHFNGDDIEVQHFPGGHTDGDSVIFYTGENVVHTGDLFFNGAFPFVDQGSGGSVDGYIANVEALLARMDAETLIVPGHGPLAAKADYETFLAMLKETSAAVRAALNSGKSVDDVVASGLDQKWASWGKGFVKEGQWIRTIAADSK